MDWDKLRIFHAAAEAGSFTHAGDALAMSQSAVSRQVSALEADLGAQLFHRHARGLILTEQGELLMRTADEVLHKLEAAKNQLADAKNKPTGALRVTTTIGLGSTWLSSRLHEFFELYPKISLQLILSDGELDVGMREADVAIRLRQPTEQDLIQRKIFTVHFHIYASPGYLKAHGQPASPADLDDHRIIIFGENAPGHLRDMNWLASAGREGEAARTPVLAINSVLAIKRAVQNGIGIAMLPDYLIGPGSNLVRIMQDEELPSFETYFVYPVELRNMKRIVAFRDFLIANARTWRF